MTTQDQKPAKKRRSWLLIGSLAVNLFLIGFLAIGAVRHHRDFNHGPPSSFRAMMHFMEDRRGPPGFPHHMFSDADEQVLEQIRDRHGADLTRARAESRMARDDIRDLMRDGVRDPDRLEAAFEAAAAAARDRYSRAINALLLDLAENLSDEGYRDLAGPDRD